MLRPRNMLILLVLLPWASGMQAQAAATDPNEALQALQFQNESPRPGNSNVKIPGP